MLRTITGNTGGKQLSLIQPTTQDCYEAYAKESGFEPTWETLSSGMKAYWIGDPKAEKTIIFFYGGGYSVPISPGYLPSLALLTANTPNLSVLIPDFTLSWSATYPTQLRQGVDTLKFVVYTLNKPPSNVSIAGDSAGGNLALGVLAHLLHPHPEIPPLDIIHEGRRGKLARAVLISPWASFATDWGSVKRNTKKDMLTEHINQVWSRNFLGRRGRDGWNEALSVDGEWWNGLEDVIQEVLITAGEEEILADCIKELGKRFQNKHSNVTVVVAEGEWHDNFFMDLPLDEVGISKDAIVAFCSSRL